MLRQINGWRALCLCWVSGRFQHVAVTNNTDTKSDLNSTLEYRMPNSWRFTRCSRNAVGLGCAEMCLFHNVFVFLASSPIWKPLRDLYRSFRLTSGMLPKIPKKHLGEAVNLFFQRVRLGSVSQQEARHAEVAS